MGRLPVTDPGRTSCLDSDPPNGCYRREGVVKRETEYGRLLHLPFPRRNALLQQFCRRWRSQIAARPAAPKRGVGAAEKRSRRPAQLRWRRQPATASSALSTEISQRLPEQNADALGGSLLRASVDFLVGQSAERVLDDHWGKIVHPERVALHLRFVQEFGGDDDHCRAAGGFESDAVMRTARRA